jgi:uncharacterized protein
MFSPEAVRRAEGTLDQIERDAHLTVTIQTVKSLGGESISDAALSYAKRARTEGLFLLIAKDDQKSRMLRTNDYKRSFPGARLARIEHAFDSPFRRGEFDNGLAQGVKALDDEVVAAKVENGGVLKEGAVRQGPLHRAPIHPMPGHRAGQRASGLSSLLMIGLGILAILFIIRLFSGMAGGGARGYPPGPGGRMGGPGYGAPGYGGGGGGGFFSSMMGGIGGALAGNWLYDQFSGRHHDGGNYADNTSYGDGGQDYSGDTGGGNWDAGGGVSDDWGGGGGGGDWGGGGGGDWGGGDGGGGGDW